MMKKDDLPAMPFYVGDWLKAPDIQCLSYELKGLWFEMLCFMWESTERGYLVKANKKPYSPEELSRLLRLPEDLLKQNLKHLLEFGIYSVRETDGAIYSRRMVRDQEIREIRKKAGSLGGKQSFANRFAQAKSEANSEYENEDVNRDINKELIKVWISTFGRNPNLMEQEETEKHFKEFGIDKTKRIYKEAYKKGFRNIFKLTEQLNPDGSIKPKDGETPKPYYNRNPLAGIGK